MIYEFKSTLNRQWAVVSWSSIKYGLFIAYYFYSGPSSIYVIIVLIFAFFDLLPAVLLHGQYYKHDKNAKLVVDTSNSTIKYQNKREEKKVHFAEISFIKYVSSYGNDVISPAIYFFWTILLLSNLSKKWSPDFCYLFNDGQYAGNFRNCDENIR